MRNFFIRIILSLTIIYIIAHYLPFVVICKFSGVIFFMIFQSILNLSLKPILILFTIPITLITFGLFLIVVNAIMVMVADYFIMGIHIGNGLQGAVIFSIILSASNFFIEKLLNY